MRKKEVCEKADGLKKESVKLIAISQKRFSQKQYCLRSVKEAAKYKSGQKKENVKRKTHE